MLCVLGKGKGAGGYKTVGADIRLCPQRDEIRSFDERERELLFMFVMLNVPIVTCTFRWPVAARAYSSGIAKPCPVPTRRFYLL